MDERFQAMVRRCQDAGVRTVISWGREPAFTPHAYIVANVSIRPGAKGGSLCVVVEYPDGKREETGPFPDDESARWFYREQCAIFQAYLDKRLAYLKAA